jgi:hypothetical protein
MDDGKKGCEREVKKAKAKEEEHANRNTEQKWGRNDPMKEVPHESDATGEP